MRAGAPPEPGWAAYVDPATERNFRKGLRMRKLVAISAAALTLGTLVSTAADARPRGYYGHGHYHGGYAYRGGRRGINTGAAVGLGIAGLAAGAIAAGAARDAYYRDGYAPTYGYGYAPGYGAGYGYGY